MSHGAVARSCPARLNPGSLSLLFRVWRVCFRWRWVTQGPTPQAATLAVWGLPVCWDAAAGLGCPGNRSQMPLFHLQFFVHTSSLGHAPSHALSLPLPVWSFSALQNCLPWQIHTLSNGRSISRSCCVHFNVLACTTVGKNHRQQFLEIFYMIYLVEECSSYIFIWGRNNCITFQFNLLCSFCFEYAFIWKLHIIALIILCVSNIQWRVAVY